jgi:hypothetical protein
MELFDGLLFDMENRKKLSGKPGRTFSSPNLFSRIISKIMLHNKSSMEREHDVEWYFEIVSPKH